MVAAREAIAAEPPLRSPGSDVAAAPNCRNAPAEGDWWRPEIAGRPRSFRHYQRTANPVVEAALGKAGDRFVSNDWPPRLMMGDRPVADRRAEHGRAKSTFLRQKRPDRSCWHRRGCLCPGHGRRESGWSTAYSSPGRRGRTILARGPLSTFMVEMVETAAILAQADGGAAFVNPGRGSGAAPRPMTGAGARLGGGPRRWQFADSVGRCLFATHLPRTRGGWRRNLRGPCPLHHVRAREWQGRNLVAAATS